MYVNICLKSCKYALKNAIIIYELLATIQLPVFDYTSYGIFLHGQNSFCFIMGKVKAYAWVQQPSRFKVKSQFSCQFSNLQYNIEIINL